MSTRTVPGLFWFVFENSSDAVVVTDANGDVALANKVARNGLGVELGRYLTLPGVSHVALAQFRSDLRAKDGTAVELRVKGDRNDTRHFVLEGAIHDGYDVITVRDVTEQWRLDEELRHLRRIESLGFLTASVVHDFNNLLTPIVCMSALLESSLKAPDPAAEMVSDIRTAAERAAGLVRALLGFVRREASQPARVDIAEVASDLEGLVRRVVGENVDVQLDLEPELTETIVDREQLDHVILNLVSNARDAMPRGGRLTITTSIVPRGEAEGCPRDQEYVAIRLTDTGVGMSQEVQERLFERFFTTKKAGLGTGLGLTTAQRFASRSNGSLVVRSEEGQGTSAILYLPRAGARPAILEPITVRERLPGGTETILVVEDDEHVRRGLRAVLEELGYQVLEARDADGAIRGAEGHSGRLDLVLVDVVLSGVGTSGRALVDQLTGIRKVKVLYMSGHTDKVIQSHGVDETVDALLRKAFSPAELARAVRDALDGKRRGDGRPQTSAA